MTAPTEREVIAAAEAALRGELVVIPTDTVYGVGTRPDDPRATLRLFEAKARPKDLELPILVASRDEASAIGRFEGPSGVLAERCWPGALTIVVRRGPASLGWDLGGNPDTVGIRTPDSPTALAVLRRTGPLAVTSANRSGSPTPRTCREIAGIFGDAVAVTVCADDEIAGVSSTVVDCTGPVPIVLRPGALSEADIEDALHRA
jgi:tRNA threonylcarbamoyl adenosine modification protein (Sua5/YciO/YrdC/YwlC family)